ncbi:hypothetical protein ACP4OV_003836 [Aristida adscensionis]
MSPPPPEFLCPITLDLMRDPVIGPTGITYDRAAIEPWLLLRRTCPVSGARLRPDDLVPNHTLRRLLHAWCAAADHLPARAGPRMPPTTPADDAAEAEAAARTGDAALCAEAARRVRRLARDGDRSRRLLASAGAARALAAAFARFAGGADGADGALDDVLAALVLVAPLDAEAVAAVGSSSASVSRLVAVAVHGGPQKRLQAVVMIREVVSLACAGGTGTAGAGLVGNADAVADVVVKTIRDAVCPHATKACLVAARHLARADERAAARLAAAGLVPLLVELLAGGADRSTAEKALAALDAAVACPGGRARARADALAVPVLVKKMFRVSDAATELAVAALWRICRKQPDDDGAAAAAARRLAVVEALQVGALQKLLLLLQVGCTEETKEKATALLRLMVKYQARVEWIDTMDFRGLDRRDTAILIG